MATTVESMVDSFAMPLVPPIIGTPNYESLSTVFRILSANATSVPCPLGNGQLGWLSITIPEALFDSLSNTPFVLPTNPGYAPDLPMFPTADQIAHLQATHKEQLRLWNEYLTVDRALKQQLTGAIEPKFIASLRNRLTGYSTLTTRNIMEHLLHTYGRILPSEIVRNDTNFRKEYDANEPIEILYEQIEDAMQLAADADAPYNENQVLANALNLVQRTKVYRHSCHEWQRRPQDEKTWQNFKSHFSEAANELREDRTTGQDHGYHQNPTANNAMELFTTETAEAFANLANATASDRSMMADLMATNKTLLEQLSSLTREVAQLRTASAPPRGRGDGDGGGNRSTRKRYNNTNYCWSHGYDISREHDSSSCRFPKDGHTTAATRTNNMGGSQNNKDRRSA
jgi:hypothetical protein